MDEKLATLAWLGGIEVIFWIRCAWDKPISGRLIECEIKIWYGNKEGEFNAYGGIGKTTNIAFEDAFKAVIGEIELSHKVMKQLEAWLETIKRKS